MKKEKRKFSDNDKNQMNIRFDSETEKAKYSEWKCDGQQSAWCHYSNEIYMTIVIQI